MHIGITLWSLGLTGDSRILFKVFDRLVLKRHKITFIDLECKDQHVWFKFREVLRKNGLDTVKKFSWDKTANDVEDILLRYT